MPTRIWQKSALLAKPYVKTLDSTNILIAGCGDLGTRVGVELTKSGYCVTGVRRSQKASPPFTFVKADLSQASHLDVLPKIVDLVIITITPDARDETHYRRAYVLTIDALRKRYPRAYFLFVSSTAVYGQSQGEWVDEKSETSPSHFNGKILLEAEQQLHDLSSCVVRFSGIYGRKSTYLDDRLRSGITLHPTQSIWTNRIHIDDCVGVLTFLSERVIANKTVPDIVLASDLQPLRQFERYARYAQAHHLPLPTPTDKISSESVLNNQGKRCRSLTLAQIDYRWNYPYYQP